MTAERQPKPGNAVILMELPPGFVADLPAEDQTAAREAIGRPVLLNEYDDEGRAELEFIDSAGVTHFLYVSPEYIAPAE